MDVNPNCTEAIISNDYTDLVIAYNNVQEVIDLYNPICIQILNERFLVVHIPKAPTLALPLSGTPSLYSPMDTSAVEASGITAVRNRPNLSLGGRDVLIAILDSGIDYTHPAFIYEDNTSKISFIWDQTIQGNPPEGFYYGSEYSNSDINEALASDNPISIVPSMDVSGHGTFIAGVAAGREILSENFVGAAPDSDLIIVKLKNAKEYLRDILLIDDVATVYQSSDIMLGMRYALEKASILNKPLVICLPLGSNQSGHDGRTILESYIAYVSTTPDTCVCIPTGNEANAGRHAEIDLSDNETHDVQFRVGANERGFIMEIWGSALGTIVLSIYTPSGEYVGEITPLLGQNQTIRFALDRTVLFISYQTLEEISGNLLIALSFDTPTEGIWTLSFKQISPSNNLLNLWLPCCNWISRNTVFLEPSPNTTITSPANAITAISVAGYNHTSNSIYPPSGRGYTRLNQIKPDFAAPAVNVYGPTLNNAYTFFSGTSAASAITTGAVAILLEWFIHVQRLPSISSELIKNVLIRGATRNPNVTFPNRETGYGTLDLLNSFLSL